MDIIIVLLILFHCIKCQKIISIPYTFNYNDYQVQIQFPSIDKKLKLMLDMSYDYTFIRRVAVEDPLLKDKQTVTINHHNSIQSVPFLTDDIYLPQTQSTFHGFNFLVIPSSSSSSIGLAATIDNKETSFIYQLYKKGIIEHLIFSLDTVTKRKSNSVIYFGGVPEESIRNKYKTSIKVDSTNKKWGIKLNEIYFGNHQYTYNNKDFAFINIGNDRIFAPKKVVNHLSETIFKEYVQNKTCTVTIKNEKQFINCPCNVVDTFPNMTFVFDRYHFILEPQKLFIKVEAGMNCLFLIQNNYLPYEDINTWFIGNFFLDKFVTEFNYEKKEINFYTDEIVQRINNEYLLSNVIYSMMICELLIGIVLLIMNRGILLNKKL